MKLWFNHGKGKCFKKFTNGRSIEDTLEYMEDLVRAGA